MAVSAFKSTTRRQWDIRGVEIDGILVPATPRVSNTSPTRRSTSRNLSPTRRSMSRNPSPTRRSMSKNPSPTRGRRSTSKAPSPTRGRRAMSKAPSPTRGRRAMSKAPSPTRRRSTSKAPSPTRRRSMSKAPSPTRRSLWRAPSPTGRSTTRAASPSSRRRSVSRNPSPQRGRRAASRGPSPNRQQGPPSHPGKTESRPFSPSRRLSLAGPRSRPASPPKTVAKPVGRVFRRTQSFADLSLPQFVADSPVAFDSPPVVATRQSGVGVRASGRTHPSDSESEAEPRYARRLDRSFSRRDSTDNDSFQSSRSAGKRTTGVRAGSLRRTSSTQMELRRSSTNLEISDTSTPVYYQKPKPAEEHRNAGKDGGEVQGEQVKTIQEVHTQTKVQTLCYNCLYDVSASADPPSDAVSPIGGVKIKVLGNSREAPPGDAATDFVTRRADVHRAVSDARVELGEGKDDDLRKVLAQKLALSEQKVAELWSQFSSEERKCLHLVKSVKDIKEGLLEAEADELDLEVALPDADDLKPQQHRYPMDDMDETDFIRQSLDEEAARYFEECAIIANFDANVADDISVSSSRISDGESTVWDDRRSSRRQSSESSHDAISSRTKAIAPLDDEGMLLPWLDWEPEVDLGRKERLEKAVGDFREWKSAWARKSVEWGRSSNRERGRDEGAVNVDEFLFERTRLQPRISHGRMLVCGGKR